MRDELRTFLPIVILILFSILLSIPALAFNAASTTVYILSEPQITNLEITQDQGITCSWTVDDPNTDEIQFSNIIWLRNGEFFLEEQLVCSTCSSSIQPQDTSGDWTCMLTVRDSNNLESSSSVSLTINPQSPTGFATFDLSSITDTFTNFGEMIAGIGEIFPEIVSFFTGK